MPCLVPLLPLLPPPPELVSPCNPLCSSAPLGLTSGPPPFPPLHLQVYHDICGDDDPLCYGFGFYDHKARDPTPPMANSLLYKLVMNGLRPGVHVDDTLFKEVHTTQYGMVRIYKVWEGAAGVWER